MEPNWTKSISDATVCNFFYTFYMIYLIIFVISLITTISIFWSTKKLGLAGNLMGIQGVIVTGVGATMMLFYYLICDRALIATAQPAAQPEQPAAQPEQVGLSGEDIEAFRSRNMYR